MKRWTNLGKTVGKKRIFVIKTPCIIKLQRYLWFCLRQCSSIIPLPVSTVSINAPFTCRHTTVLVFPSLTYPPTQALVAIFLLKKQFSSFSRTTGHFIFPLGLFFTHHIWEHSESVPLPLMKFSQHDTLQICPPSSKFRDFIFPYGWLLFHCVSLPSFIFLFLFLFFVVLRG